jgi:hypothetical protein
MNLTTSHIICGEIWIVLGRTCLWKYGKKLLHILKSWSLLYLEGYIRKNCPRFSKGRIYFVCIKWTLCDEYRVKIRPTKTNQIRSYKKLLPNCWLCYFITNVSCTVLFQTWNKTVILFKFICFMICWNEGLPRNHRVSFIKSGLPNS